MDHMDHSQMDHSMPMEDMCSMNMLLSWDYHNLCLFSSLWHIKTLPQFVLSLAAVSLMAFGYEYLRVKLTRKTPRGVLLDDEDALTNTPLPAGRAWSKSIGYGLLVGYSYVLMLIFMSYNAWVMAAVVIGAIVGHHIFQGEPRDTMACH